MMKLQTQKYFTSKTSLSSIANNQSQRKFCTNDPESNRLVLRQKFDQIATKLGIEKQEDWYVDIMAQIRSKKSKYNISNTLLFRKIKSYKEGLRIAYPEFEWNMLLFPSVPKGYYDNIDNLRDYLTHLGQQLGVKQMDDWYSVRYNNIKDSRVFGAVTKKYGGSLVRTLMDAFPEHPWCIYRFAYVPTGHWDKEENHKKFLEWAMDQLNIKKGEDWARVTNTQLYELGGNSLIKRYHSVGNLVKKFFPELYLHPSHFYKTHKTLLSIVEDLFITKSIPSQKLRRFPRSSPIKMATSIA